MIKIVLKRSYIGITPKQRLILQALGLKKIGSTKKKADDKATMGMINKGSYVIAVFQSIGWKWGGDWSGSEDYMHFSSNGH